MSFLKSFFSLKKIFYPKVSFLSVWDSKTHFLKTSHILAFAKLKNVRIGKYSRIGYNCNVSNSVIGNFTAIGRNCNIWLGQHPMNHLSTNSIFYRKGQLNDRFKIYDYKNQDSQIVIGSDVWVGINSTIMDGVNIGDGAVIAAGSIVTKNVPPFAIVGGVPAKIIKYRFDEKTIEFLLNLKWWHMSDCDILKNLNAFSEDNLNVNTLTQHFQINK